MSRKTPLPASIREALARARSLVVLTGAGMSADSGVPVFRGAGGLWEGFRPEELATPQAFARDPVRVWRWYRWRLDGVLAAAPHAGYEALARLEAQAPPDGLCVVTQNVDGLHLRAGSRSVLELHGNITRARCDAGCGAMRPARTVDPERTACTSCSGRFRPDVVWFGEPLDGRVLREAFRRVESADLVWLVGTSGLVAPAASLPELARTRGIPVIEVNPEPTPFSAFVTASLREPAAAAVPRLVASLSGMWSPGF